MRVTLSSIGLSNSINCGSIPVINSMSGGISSETLSSIGLTCSIICGRSSEIIGSISSIISLSTGIICSPSGIRSSSIVRESPLHISDKLLYLTDSISPSLSRVLSMLFPMCAIARTASSPRSSHFVPYKATPAALRSTSLLHSASFSLTSLNA